MLYRKIGKVIEDHLKANQQKILLIDGARQVGKTYIVRYRKVELMGFWNLSKILIHKMSSIKNFRRGIYENGFLDFYLKKIRYRMC